MSGKPKPHYFNGRGRMETVRWLLAAAGVEFEEQLFETREEFEELVQVGVRGAGGFARPLHECWWIPLSGSTECLPVYAL
nr:glutathione S-transferase A4 isoform X2 [Oryctolagus cuniculus]